MYIIIILTILRKGQIKLFKKYNNIIYAYGRFLRLSVKLKKNIQVMKRSPLQEAEAEAEAYDPPSETDGDDEPIIETPNQNSQINTAFSR